VFGQKVRELLEAFEEKVSFYSPDVCFQEVGRYSGGSSFVFAVLALLCSPALPEIFRSEILAKGGGCELQASTSAAVSISCATSALGG
jgi:hypothetical protein